ncbi:nucleoside deaminase [Miltoncostaea oceani]|uniref:nucleoside deaminase n=1 Tax=Miltoncostaea oceani TaxID=2843216 RepID=UPI001C3D6FD8|nr:nucleoside deaminase [Miltoncostaea oceani]
MGGAGGIGETDVAHLRRAIALAHEARAAGDEPYGALLVGPDGRVLAEDRNRTVTARDVTAHPELVLARWAARELAPGVVRGTTMYTSCRPCAMCATAIGYAGLGRVVYALSTGQHDAVRPPGDPPATRWDGPALHDEARAPLEGWSPP